MTKKKFMVRAEREKKNEGNYVIKNAFFPTFLFFFFVYIVTMEICGIIECGKYIK